MADARRRHTAEYKRLRRALRLERISRLRAGKAPRWIIRTEQVAMVLERAGFKVYGLGHSGSQRQAELYAKFVIPTMGVEDD